VVALPETCAALGITLKRLGFLAARKIGEDSMRMVRRKAAGACLWLGLLIGVATPVSALTLEEARQNGVTIAIFHEPPVSSLDEQGKPVGTYWSLNEAVLKGLGITKITPVMTEWSSLIPNLLAKRSDLVLNMYILPKRCEQVAFSEPVWKGSETFVVLKGNPKDLHSYEDAASKGATLALLSGSAEVDFAKRAGTPDDRILLLQDPPALLQALITGRADGLALPVNSSMDLAAQSDGKAEIVKDFKMNPEWLPYSATVFRKEDTELLQAFNAQAKTLIGTPEFMAMMKPMGYGEENLPGAKTAAEKCQP
jgi:polar amino acid transport system substrate-binding protein